MKNTITLMSWGMAIFVVVNFLVLGYAVRQTRYKSPAYALAQAAMGGAAAHGGAPVDPAKLQAAMTLGKTEFAKCAACHGPDGKGLQVGPALMAPSLAGSAIATGDPDSAALVVLKGIRKEGDKYMGIMTPLPIDDAGLAGVLTYVRNSFGNSAGLITPEEVAAARIRFNSVPQMIGRNEIDSLLASNPKVAPVASGPGATGSVPGGTALAAIAPPVKVEEPWVPIEGIRVVGGRVPSQRPAEAPPEPLTSLKDDKWFKQATHGLVEPHPTSFRFLEDQGDWFNPFIRPGMTGPYDIRSWHAE